MILPIHIRQHWRFVFNECEIMIKIMIQSNLFEIFMIIMKWHDYVQ